MAKKWIVLNFFSSNADVEMWKKTCCYIIVFSKFLPGLGLKKEERKKLGGEFEKNKERRSTYYIIYILSIQYQ